MTKDMDFHQRAFLHGPPPKVVWIRLGNCTTKKVETLLRMRAAARLAARSLLLDGAARGATLVAVGERGHILVSKDGGETWTQSDVPTRAMLTGVWMHDERLGWAVGHDETVLRTRDGRRDLGAGPRRA